MGEAPGKEHDPSKGIVGDRHPESIKTLVDYPGDLNRRHTRHLNLLQRAPYRAVILEQLVYAVTYPNQDERGTDRMVR